MNSTTKAEQNFGGGILKQLNSSRKNYKFSNYTQLYMMTLPFIALVMVFNYLPLWGWSIAFVDYSPGVSVFKSAFVGLDNFKSLFSTSEFTMVLRNTLALSSLNILTSVIPILFAILLTELRNSKFQRIIQTVTSFPNFISWIIVYAIFYSFFSVDDGLINQILFNKLHLFNQPTDILANPKYTWGLMTVLNLWKNMGYTAIIYIAAIAGIDQELYQAAQVDGAGRFKQIWHITIPGILPTYSVMLLLSVGNMLNAGFDQYWVFRNSLTNDVIQVIDTFTYYVGLINMDFAYSTAAGIFKTAISIILLFVANSIVKKATGKSIL